MSNLLTNETIITDASFASAIDQVVPSQLAVKTYIGHENTKEPTGFKDPELVVVTYDSAARTITLTGTVEAYYRGVQVSALTSGWVSPVIPPGPTQGYFLYYDGANFVWSTTVWSFDTLHIAYVYYESGGTFRFAIRETHGLMPWQAHKRFHETIGTDLRSGGDLSSYVLASTAAADRRPDVASSVIADEDLETTNPALTSKSYTHLYLTSAGTSTFSTANAEILPVTGATPYYNQFTGGNWVQTAVPPAQYTMVFLVAVPTSADSGSQTYRYLWLQGQLAGTLANAQAFDFHDMNIGQLSGLATEFVPIGKIILRNSGANWELTSVEKLTVTRVAASTAGGNYISSVETDSTLTGTGTPASPLSVVTTALSHNSLSGLQGGTAAQFYHMTSAEYTGTGTGDFVRRNNATLLGTTNANVVVASGIKTTSPAVTAGANALWADFATTVARFTVTGPDTTTFAPFELNQYSSDLSLFRAPFEVTANGQIKLTTGTTSTSTSTGTLVVNGGVGISGAMYVGSYIYSNVYTVATLPTGTIGMRAFVSDANATTFASVVAGGGANGVPVYSDGTNWRIG